MDDRPRLLVVEDEFIVAFELRTVLEEMGFSVCGVVSSGEEAFQIAERERPDCVLMDVSIKGEFDGIEAARRIRSRLGLPTAFLTGFPRDQVMEKARDVEPIGCFLKPLDYEELKTALEEFFHPGAVDGA